MSTPLLKIIDVEKSFGDNKIHKGVNFELYKSEGLGLLGGSGTGKSVLLRSLIGLEFIDKGKIVFKNDELQDLTEQEYLEYRKSISYSFQSGALFDSLNVYENIAYPLFEHTNLTEEEISIKITDVLELVDLQGKGHLMPSDLSGGMQKRIGMARSIILGPDIVLYDEPTAGLDPANTQNVVKVMRKLKENGQAFIFVTHDIASAVHLCDRILILSEGKIIFNDTPRNFLLSDDDRVKRFIIAENEAHK